MKIRDVDAVWLHCPLPEAKQHTSDFGRISAFEKIGCILSDSNAGR